MEYLADLLDKILSFQNHDVSTIVVRNPLLLNLALVAVFGTLFFIPSRKVREDQFLGFPFTDTLRGIAILFIIIHHLCRHAISDPRDLFLFYGAGHTGVAIFLFLSGYGLTESAKKRGVESFLKERLLRVYVPFVTISTFLILLDYWLLGKHIGPKAGILAIIGIKPSDRNFWFIKFLIFWYTVFYATTRVQIDNKGKVIVLVSVSLIILTSSYFPHAARINALSFPAGVVSSLYRSQATKLCEGIEKRKVKVLLALLSTFVLFRLLGWAVAPGDDNRYVYAFEAVLLMGYAFTIVLFFLLGKSKNEVIRNFSLLTFVLVSLTLSVLVNLPRYIFMNTAAVLGIFLAILIVRFISKGRVSYLYEYFGKISLELFLLHGAFMCSYDFILFKLPLHYSFFLYFLVLIIVSAMCNKVFRKVDGLISQRMAV